MTPFLHPYAAPAATDFVTVVRGEGAAVFDDAGTRYVDALASLWYCNIGHGRAEVAEAAAAQMQSLAAFHTFEKFTNPPAEQLCTLLVGMAPMPDARVFLVSSGSEAVDSAIKLVRAAHAQAGEPQRTVVISRTPSYHGVTYGGLSATGLPANHAGFGPLLPDVVRVPHDDLEAVARVFEERPGEVAAVLAEPVVGAGGVYPPVSGYLEGLRRLCDEHGAFLVFDEVICGFGRLGTWWAAEHYGVRPDVVTFAKGVTSGYVPLGGVLVGQAVRERLEASPDFVLRHGHTYSGHPTACAAALVVQDITRREGLVGRAKPIGERLAGGLRTLLDRPEITDVRGDGAVWAVGLADGVSAPAVRDRMLARRVIARPIGESTVAFCPPLVIDDADIDACPEALRGALDDL
jgi:putrescine---pyruvate transaminase